MGLKALEFSDSISDSPWFRQNLREHEQALDETYKNIKRIEAQCRDLINCTRQLSNAQRSFAKALSDFKIETVGTNQTDDERVIGTCLKSFAKLINQVEDERLKIITEAESHYLEPIKRFRTEAIGRVLNDEKEKYRNESRKFHQNLEKHLHLSTVRKNENDFREADAQLDVQQLAFCKASLQYVAEIQSVQERMKFEFVETLSSFLYSWLSFYHVGNVIHEDFKPGLDGIQVRVQKLKDGHQATVAETEDLKQRILKSQTRNSNAIKPDGSVSVPNVKQGYMYMQEKTKFPKTISRDVLVRWTKYYCVYQKETRIFTVIPCSSSGKTDMKGALGQSVNYKLKECIRRSSDSIDRRFCFDVISDEKSEPMTFQGLSEEDRRQWLDAMDGKQPVYSAGSGPSCSGVTTQLDDTGFEFVNACIGVLEDRGIREQGLYRNCGVTSKVQKLMQLGLDKRKGSGEKLNVGDESEWETKTISSAVKTFLRNLPEPLMTFELHSLFINAAKMDDHDTRVDHVHYYVYKLPAEHKRMLEIVIRHLKKVADHCNENLMTVGNLGVCFGPTLLRPKEETMAAIMDIKFCNVVVEVLIANCDKIFNTEPPKSFGQPCPPKPDHRAVHQEHSQPLPTSSYRSVIRPNAEKDNGRMSMSQSATATTSMAISSRPKAVLPTESPAIRARNSKPPTHVTAAAATAHIYDTVPTESMIPGMSRKLVPLHGTASTSGVTTPTTSPTQNAGAPRARDDSSDSLNSILSHESDSPKPSAVARSAAVSTTPSATAGNPEPRGKLWPAVALESRPFAAKMSTSYAPPYNPLACETSVQRQSQQHLSHSDLLSARTPPLFSAVNAVQANNIQPRKLDSTLDSQSSHSSFTDSSSYSSTKYLRRVKTLYACTPDHESELCFQPGQIITNVYESAEDGWLVGTLNGKTGLIPSNYVDPLP